MCGIAGIVALAAETYRPRLEGMIQALKHRGPDDDGRHFFTTCALGHTRLSIVDLGGGQQPMVTAGGQVAISFNGEIYGYKALRQELSPYPFRTVGDTEVILAMYERDGADMMPRLPGMFAFAIWDDRRRELFCARDRFGEKPFYYAIGRAGEFIFASEIKAILATGLIEPEFNPEALCDYLRRGYVNPNRTIYRNVCTLPPAHQLLWKQGTVEVKRYWKLPETVESISLAEATEQFRHLFDQAVARQLVADVPVGTFLSGGLDSSTIVAVAAKNHPQCRTFSFGFGKSINELPYAREVADQYHTQHLELLENRSDLAELLVKMQVVYDEPLGDPANVPTYLLSRLARQHITVALAGEGGDELTGGYSFWYRPLFQLERARRLPEITATLIRMVAALCKLSRTTLPRPLAELWEGFFLKSHYGNSLAAHTARTVNFNDQELRGMGVDLPLSDGGSTTVGDLNSVMHWDVDNYLAGDILTKTDRASMAWGLEMRCPFLDMDFASFCLTLPYRLKITTSCDKFLLRQVYEQTWPASIRRRAKQGFGPPIWDWFKQPEIQELKHSVFGNSQSKLYQYLSSTAVRGWTEENGYRTWVLLILGLWLERHGLSGKQGSAVAATA
ncbi:MAG: asparagine synthase (glutamine-hydrolyzing) [Verrucomicrobiota bacterium]